MKKVILIIGLCVLLFGESEANYKERYDYLTSRFTSASHDAFMVSLEANKICFSGDRYCERESRIAEQQLPDLEREVNALKDKIMDLKFKIQDDLKLTPEWFTFKVK